MDKITILGIGNILLKDEGVGVKVVEKLMSQYQFPKDVQVLDGGTLGMSLIPYLDGSQKLIILDAVSGKLVPGSIYVLRDEDVKVYFKQTVSLHDLGIQDVLAMLEVLEKPINEIVVFGVQPEIIDVGLELSSTVAPAVNELISLVIGQLNTWQVEVVASENSSTVG